MRKMLCKMNGAAFVSRQMRECVQVSVSRLPRLEGPERQLECRREREIPQSAPLPSFSSQEPGELPASARRAAHRYRPLLQQTRIQQGPSGPVKRARFKLHRHSDGCMHQAAIAPSWLPVITERQGAAIRGQSARSLRWNEVVSERERPATRFAHRVHNCALDCATWSCRVFLRPLFFNNLAR
jgi:hypothetical protein